MHAGYLCFGNPVLENLRQSCSFFSQRTRIDRKTLLTHPKDRMRQLTFKGIKFAWTTGVNLATVAMNFERNNSIRGCKFINLYNSLPPALVVPMRNVQFICGSTERASAKHEIIDGIDGIALVLDQEGPSDLDRLIEGKGNGWDHSTIYEWDYLTK
jgi:hypothetical protein